MTWSQAQLEAFYRGMQQIRLSELALQKLFADGQVPGFLHLSIGQEAVAVGVSHALGPEDTVSSNHRGHGHTLAKGVDPEGFFAEILGRATGLCKGRGGSMHVADLGRGMLGANGIVGAGLPITAGSALAHRLRGRGQVAVVYFGDGALAEGVVHECLNIAALWALPMLFVCENNGWSEFSPTERQLATTLERLAGAFSIRYRAVDGNRVEEVAAAAQDLVGAMRELPAPAVLECATTRVRGHFEGDRQDYRDPAELAGLGARDPIVHLRALLAAQGTAPDWFALTDAEIGREVDAAVAAALAAPVPDIDDYLADVYSPKGA